jgi:putative tryptophan/tyrosine transport system substrate-binding protein
MRRRELLLWLATALMAARAVRAQQKAMPVVGFLSVYSPPTDPGEVARGPVREGLKETGFVEGQNMSIERRWAEGHYDRLPAMAADLVSRKVDLIVTFGGTLPALAAKSATSTIPIVFSGLNNPVASGLVASLARPGGNITGFSNFGVS